MKHNLVRRLPDAPLLWAYFYQLMTSNLVLAQDIKGHINTNFPNYRNDLFEEVTEADILKILLCGSDYQSFLPEVLYFFKRDDNVTFNDYKNAPEIFTDVDGLSGENGLLVMSLFCSQILKLYNHKGKCLSEYCSDLDLGRDGKVLLRSSSSPFWEEYRYSDEELSFINSFDPSDGPDDFDRISHEREDVIHELFPPYSHPGSNGDWLSNLSEEEVINLLGDSNFSYRFLKSLPLAYSANLQAEPYHLLASYYQNNPDLATIAVKSNCLAFTLLSEQLRNSREFIIQLLTNSNTTQGIYPFLKNEFKGDSEIVKLCLSWGVGILEPFVPLTDIELLLCAIKEDAKAFSYAADELKSNRDFIFDAIRANSLSIQHIPRAFCNDREIVAEALRSDGNLLQYASGELQCDREIVLEAAVRSRAALSYASPALREDMEFLTLIANRIGNNRLIQGSEYEEDDMPF